MELQEMVRVIEAFSNGKAIELKSKKNQEWSDCTDPIWDFSSFDYRIKYQPTREEITENWVKDNNIIKGSKVRVIKRNPIGYFWGGRMDGTIGKVYPVESIALTSICLDGFYYQVEALEPYKEEYIPFTWDDRDLFRDRWVKKKGNNSEYRIIQSEEGWVHLGVGSSLCYSTAFELLSFIDGTPFGKLKQ